MPTPRGVLFVPPKTLALYSEDLAVQRWARVLPGTSSGLVPDGKTVLYGPYLDESDGTCWLARVEVDSGDVLATWPVPRSVLVGATATTLLLNGPVGKAQYEVICVDRVTGLEMWRRASHPGLWAAPSDGDRYFVDTAFGAALVCLDVNDGRELWRFEPPTVRPGEAERAVLDRWNRISSGFPSIAVVGDRVIVTTLDCVVHAVAVADGTLIQRAEPPLVGPYVVTDTSVFFARPFLLSEFDHREMRETNRTEYRAEVEPLYKGQKPTLRGFWLTEKCVFWTTAHGALMGVNRRPDPDGARRTWVDELPGAVMGIADHPVSCGPYLYYAVVGGSPGLVCYRAVGDGEEGV